MRVVRDIYDTTQTPASFTREYAWIGCIPSQLVELFPPSDDRNKDALGYHESADGKVRKSTRFEAYVNKSWHRIDDPRTCAVPTTEKDLIDLLSERGCLRCYIVNPDAYEAGEICTDCEQAINYDDLEHQIKCFHCKTPCDAYDLNDDGCCKACDHLVPCGRCPYYFEPTGLTDGYCESCLKDRVRDAKLDKLLAAED